jgi:glycosyltransferase involved in cell wall biosynthesis
MIAVVVLTYDRLHLLRQCVANVLLRTSSATSEIVIWNNGSTDGTREYLASIADCDPRVRIVNHEENIGQNAYTEAFALTTSDYLVEVDDDIVDAPQDWDRALLDAFTKLPEVGFLAADLADNQHDEVSFLRHHIRPHVYTSEAVNGVELLHGPTGGGCAITSREIYERVGGFRQNKKRTFWLEAGAYIADVQNLGFVAAILADIRVLHAGSPYYSKPHPDKRKLTELYLRQARRKNFVKRVLLRIPPIRMLNARYGWFGPPEQWWEDYLEGLVRRFAEASAS